MCACHPSNIIHQTNFCWGLNDVQHKNLQYLSITHNNNNSQCRYTSIAQQSHHLFSSIRPILIIAVVIVSCDGKFYPFFSLSQYKNHHIFSALQKCGRIHLFVLCSSLSYFRSTSHGQMCIFVWICENFIHMEML